MSRFSTLSILAFVAVLFVPAFLSAGIIVDQALTNTSQIRSASNNPFFPGAQNAAAINISYGTPAGGTVNGIGFHDLDLNANPQAGNGIAVNNGAPGVTFDFQFGCASDCPGSRNLGSAGISGPDAGVANAVALGNRYLTIPANNHAQNIVTFHGLQSNADVYIQLIGGQHNWQDTTRVYVDGDGVTQDTGTLIGDWTSNKTNQTAGLFGFDTTTDANGDLRIGLSTTRFGGVAAIIVQQSANRVN